MYSCLHELLFGLLVLHLLRMVSLSILATWSCSLEALVQSCNRLGELSLFGGLQLGLRHLLKDLIPRSLCYLTILVIVVFQHFRRDYLPRFYTKYSLFDLVSGTSLGAGVFILELSFIQLSEEDPLEGRDTYILWVKVATLLELREPSCHF